MLRVLLIVLVPANRLPQRVHQALRHIGPAALAALIATGLARSGAGGGSPAAVVLAPLAALVAWRTRSPLLATGAGIGAFRPAHPVNPRSGAPGPRPTGGSDDRRRRPGHRARGLAHPDDETFLTAGLIALARAAGHRVVCATATCGEQGTDDPERWPPARLGRLREYELAAALAALDVHEHTWLGFVDGGCAVVPPALGARAVRRVLDDVRPDTVVMFGPDGFTGHDDHRAVSRWVDEALAGHERPIRLLHPTVTPVFTARFGVLNDRVAVFGPGLPGTRRRTSWRCTCA